MSLPDGRCPDDRSEVAERYCMGKLSADEAREFEDHYLTCASCTEVVEKTGRFIGAMRSAGAKSDRTTPLRFTHATEDGLIVS
jgi:hypothetical protein